MPRSFPKLLHPIVQAPMAGGPSTPELAAAVCNAGGFGFLAAGYKSPSAVEREISQLRALTDRPFGLNLFVPGKSSGPRPELENYARRLQADATRLGVELGQLRWEDDGWEEKLALAVREKVAVVSFVFGCPDAAIVERLHRADLSVWVTVSSVEDARAAQAVDADALVIQGVEAGGHRGGSSDADSLSLLPLLRMVAKEVPLPCVAAGGIADGYAVAAVLCAGARAAQMGTAFLRCREATTSAPHREALQRPGRTALTRAFTGRYARGIENRFMREHAAEAPAGYPEIHHLTAPLRAKARAQGEGEEINLWAGEAYPLAEEGSAAELVMRWSEEAAQAIEKASRALARS